MIRLRNVLIRFAIVILLIPSLFYDYSATVSAAQSVETPKPAARHKTELLVKYKTNAQSQKVETGVKSKLKLSKLEVRKRGKRSGVELLKIGDADSIDATIAALRQDPSVEYAQPNYKLFVTDVADARYDEQWGLANKGQRIGTQAGTGGVDIGAEAAWATSTGSPSVLVGVLDTGIDWTHPDLQASIFANPNEIPDNGIDDDGDGYVDDVHGFDFANGDATVYDSASDDKHGTHVAGIIAAQADSQGIRGVAPNVKLLPLKFISGGSGYTSDAIDAIEYAAQMGVSIVNMSFGGPDDNPALKDAIASSGMLFVAAAGNHGMSVDEHPIYPASYRLPNLISVTAMDNRGQLAAFSGYGSTVDVAAPGVGILSTVPGGGYDYLSGTSMAAPFVTGIAALLKSQNAELDAATLAERIKSSVTDAPGLHGQVVAGGWANAAAALNGGATPSAAETQAVADTNADALVSNQPKSDSGKGAMVVSLAADISASLKEQLHYGEEGVNVSTGNYSKTVTDLSLSSPGFEISISRTYNSKDDRTTSSMGRGWTFGFEGSVKDDTTNPTGLKVVKLPNGGAQVFAKNANGTYTANDSHSTLVKLADGTHIMTTKDQYSYGFNTLGWMTWMQDRNGNRVVLEPDAAGKVRKITDTVGRAFSVNYNATGFITSIVDPMGRKIVYEYDSQNRLYRVTGPDNRLEAQYGYDSGNYLTTVQDGALTALETIVYNHTAGTDQDKVYKTTTATGNTYLYTYDTTNSKTTIKDLAGLITVKWYDSASYVTKTQDPEGRVTVVTYYLDENGVNKYGEEKTIADRAGNVTQYDRDNNGNITKITDPAGNFVQYVYDTKNNLIQETDETGRSTYYVYDAAQTQLLKTVQPLNGTDVYNDSADPSLFAITTYRYYSETDSARLGYKAKGLLQSETDPEGGVTRYTYDAWGNKLTETDPVGKVTSYEYNLLGWLTGTTSPAGYRTDNTYDLNGNLVRTVADQGETTLTEYDTLGRKIQEVSPNPYNAADDGLNDAAPTFVYRNNNVGTRYTYYPNGLVKTETDALGYTTSYTYDMEGRVATETKPGGAIYSYQYDFMDRPKKTMYQEDAKSPAVTLQTTAYPVLGDGRTQEVVTEYVNDTDIAVTTTTMDRNGREIEKTSPDGTTETTAYYPNDLVKSTTDARGNTTYNKYDGMGRLTGTWSPLDSGNYMYEGTVYDRAGRKTMEKKGKDPVKLYVVPADEQTIWSKTTYNADDTVALVVASDGARTSNQYDDDGRLLRQEIAATNDEMLATDYEYNDQDKPLKIKKHVRAGDLAGNEANDDSDTILLTSYTYDAEGNVLTETSPDGVVTQRTYDALGQMLSESVETTDDGGLPALATTKKTYDWMGNVLTSTDANGNVTQFAYDARGNLLRQTDASGGVTAYAYDRSGRKIVSVTPLNYNPNQSLGSLNRTEYVYDLMDRVLAVKEIFTEKKVNPTTFAWQDTPVERITKAYQYDENGNVVKELDGEGYAAGTGTTVQARIQSGYGTQTVYNAADLPVAALDPVGKERGLNWTTKTQYDGAGRVIAVMDANGVVKGTHYDDAGRVLSQTIRSAATAPERVLSSRTYDLAGRLTSETDGNGNVTSYTYNAFGKVRTTSETGDDTIDAWTQTSQYDVSGNLVDQRDSAGKVRQWTYDSMDRVLSQTEQKADGTDAITTSKRYDLNGNVRYETDGNGYTTQYNYDALNRVVMKSRTVTDVVGGTLTRTDSTGYDANGNVIWTQDWLGNKATSTYDSRNRLIATADASGTTTQKLEYNGSDSQVTAYDALNRVTRYTYDRDNRQLTVTDPLGHIQSQTYDKAGRKDSQTDGNGNATRYGYDELGRITSVTDALSQVTSYTYDLDGNKLTQRDGSGRMTTYEYNAANKLIRMIDNGGRTGSVGHYTYDPTKVTYSTYTGGGLLKTQLDPNGNTTTYAYDVHDRLLSQTVTGPNLTTPEKVAYTYDNNGNQLTMTDATGTTRRTYDELNRVIAKSVPDIGASTYQEDVTTGLSAGYSAEVTTDARGNKTTKTFDKVGRLYQVKDGSNSPTTYTYFADGSQQSVTYPNGAKETYTYYGNGRLQTLQNYKGSTLLDTYTYTYDNANNQVTKNETVNGVVKGTTSFAYDSLNRLRTVTEPGGKKTEYAYDGSGNRLTERTTEGTTTSLLTYVYDNVNRLLSTVQVKSTGETEQVSYTYDNNGNLIDKATETRKKIDPNSPPTPTFGIFVYGQPSDNPRISTVLQGIAHYEYNGFNQMVKATTGSGGASYAYNGDGLRVKKTIDGATTNYMYEYDQVVLETDGNGKQTARNLYGTNLISRTMGASTYTYLYNGHADVTALIDTSGAIQATYTYDAFGNIRGQTGTVNNPIRYAGYQYDEESKLYYLNARYYDPSVARFLSEDTYTGQADDPLSLNLYTYVHNEPMMYTDPTGHWPTLNLKAAVKSLGKGITSTAATFGKAATTVGNAAVKVTNTATQKVTSFSNTVKSTASSAYKTAEKKAPVIVGVAKGVYAEAKDSYKMAGNLGLIPGQKNVLQKNVERYVQNPSQSYKADSAKVKAVANAIKNPSKTTSNIKSNITDYVSKNVTHGTPESKAYVATRTVITVGSLFVGGEASLGVKGANVAGKATAKVEKAASTLAAAEKGAGKTVAKPLLSGPMAGDSKCSMLCGVGGGTTEKSAQVVDEYGILKKDTSIQGQAHHLNQDAAYRDVIPTNKGMATKLEGNAFSEVDSPHYNAHESLEQFWGQFRRGGDRYGEVPTNLQYSRAMVDSLKAAGYTNQETMQIAAKAIEQRVQHGLLGGMPVPRIPGRINQSARSR